MRARIRDGGWVVAVLFALAGCAAKPAIKVEPISLCVAPNGDDAADGSLAAPLATVKRALIVARSHRGATRTIYLRGGTYYLNKPVEVTEEDSGTLDAPLVICAYANEKPMLSGGRRITDWTIEKSDGRTLWVADLPEVRAGSMYFQELWVDGRRATRARFPNQGYLKVAAVPDKVADYWVGQTRFGFAARDVKVAEVPGDAEVVMLSRWAEGRLPISRIDQEAHRISTTKRNTYEILVGDLYWLEGAPQWLDAPGQWYLNRSQGRLYYAPMDAQDPSKTVIVAPVMAEVLNMDGSSREEKFVEHVIVRGLTFSHTEWLMPAKGGPATQPARGGFPQAASPVPGAVLVNGARRCQFERCTFENLGGYGIELARGCQHNVVSECDFRDLGAGGVKIGEERMRDADFDRTLGNSVLDCRIHDGGKFYASGVGIWLGETDENLIAHNSIHDFYYTGISVGWTWGYGATLAKKNIIEFNEIHHIGQLSNGDGPILSDMGAIYTLGIQPGTVVQNNICHDIAAIKYGGWGIYLDEGSSDIVVENNLVYRTTHGGFHQHYGKDNLIRNNIFAFGRDVQFQRTRHEEHSSLTFERNIVYWTGGNLCNFNGGGMSFINNVFWQTQTKEIHIGKMPFEQWEQSLKNQGSLVADPMFVDAEKGNFRLKSGSPAEAVGFVPFDLSGVGPRTKPAN